MKLARKLAFALALGVLLVMGVYAYLQIRRQVVVFDADLKKDQRLGRALRATVEVAWLMHGTEYAQRLIEDVDAETSEVRIRWVWLDAPDGDRRAPGLAPAELEELRRGRVIRVMRAAPDGEEWRYTYVPLSIPNEPAAAIRLAESMLERMTYLRSSNRQIVVTALVIVGVCALICMAVGVWFVGRPIRQLRDIARRVGEGDLSARIALRQHDEIGELGREINAMCDRIAEANRKLAAETEARLAAIEQLRHTDRLTTVGQLASGVAHELGTPLNVIAARAKMMAAGEAIGDEVPSHSRVIVDQAARMTDIIRQLLDFSRRQGPKLGVANLRQVAARTLEMVASFASKHGVTLGLATADDRIFVEIDQNQIQQALANVIINGIQAMTGGGRVIVHLERVEAQPPADPGGPAGTYVCVTVEDQGRGIARDDMPRIFEPFFTTKGVGEGTGLGLSVAYGIVREHGGWIEVESELGTGSRFAIYLKPVAEPPAQAVGGGS